MANRAHTHVVHAGAELSDAVRSALIAGGEQWTELRATIVDVLVEASQPVSAYDVAEAVGAKLGRRVAANSVYRILDLFVAQDLALRVESRNAYAINVHPGCRHDCIFLVCDGCGNTTHLDDDRAAGYVRRAAQAAGFLPERPVIEVHGRCAECGEARS